MANPVGFKQFSTAGNTTLFLNMPGCADKALKIFPSEQAGYADLPSSSLTMAGGELCVNACLAYAALQNLANIPVSQVHICGLTIQLSCAGAFPLWHCSAVFSNPGWTLANTPDGDIVSMGQISHALQEGPPPENIWESGARLRKLMGLETNAAGIVWWEKTDSSLKITPLVHVPQLGTCNVEQACGSGSLALAMYLGPGLYKIRQPSGEIIEVDFSGQTWRITGPVQIQARGTLWL